MNQNTDRIVERDVVKTLRSLGKGLLKVSTLLLLLEGEKHGYRIIQEIAKRSMGLWKPSPGSLYPVLRYLETLGYVTANKYHCGAKVRKIYSITDKGKKFVALFIQKLLEQVSDKVELFIGMPFVLRLDVLSRLDSKVLDIIKALVKYRAEKLQEVLRIMEKSEVKDH
ncbi:MAG: PadR family transcriptional regulator [Candidatus Nezhaarchaeales archaeon]